MAINDFLLNPITIAELIAFIVACFFVSSKKAGYWSFFILYCFILLVAELAGFYMRTVIKQPNHTVYNILMIVQVVFFLFLFYQFSQTAQLGRLIIMAGIFFLLFFSIEGFVHFFSAYNKYSRQLLSVLIVLFSCTFYFMLLKNDDVKSPLNYPPFWIVTGLFFYYFGSIVMFAFFESVSKMKLAGNVSFYTLVMGCLSCILYGSWIIGFLWKKKQMSL